MKVVSVVQYNGAWCASCHVTVILHDQIIHQSLLLSTRIISSLSFTLKWISQHHLYHITLVYYNKVSLKNYLKTPERDTHEN